MDSTCISILNDPAWVISVGYYGHTHTHTHTHTTHIHTHTHTHTHTHNAWNQWHTAACTQARQSRGKKVGLEGRFKWFIREGCVVSVCWLADHSLSFQSQPHILVGIRREGPRMFWSKSVLFLPCVTWWLFPATDLPQPPEELQELRSACTPSSWLLLLLEGRSCGSPAESP